MYALLTSDLDHILDILKSPNFSCRRAATRVESEQIRPLIVYMRTRVHLLCRRRRDVLSSNVANMYTFSKNGALFKFEEKGVGTVDVDRTFNLLLRYSSGNRYRFEAEPCW